MILFGFFLTYSRKPYIESTFKNKDKEMQLIGKIVSNPIILTEILRSKLQVIS
jgi:hypothetical protein